MPVTAMKHFAQDVQRAHDFLTQAVAFEQALPPRPSSDQARAAVVFAVGAMDAYLCDAYVDTLARTIKKCRAAKIALPSGYAKTSLPAGPLFAAHYTKRGEWALRMAARSLMARQNLQRISLVKGLLNPALPSGQKLWHDLVETLMAKNRRRLTVVTLAEYRVTPGPAKGKAKEAAVKRLLQRIGEIVQRRHDIVHNCDRPKVAEQALSIVQAKKMVSDIETVVGVLDAHLDKHRIF